MTKLIFIYQELKIKMNIDNNKTTFGTGRIWNGGNRINPTYEDGEVYMIKCNETNEVYVGSTIWGYERFNKHMSNPSHTSANSILQRGNYHIQLLEKYPCETKYELTERENHYICVLRGAGINVINKFHPPIHPDKRKEYYKEYHRKYHQDHFEPSYGMVLHNLMTTDEEKQEKDEIKRQRNIEYLKVYRENATEEQKDKIKQQQKEHYERVKHTEEYKARKQQWNEEHKEEMIEYQKNWMKQKRDNDEEYRKNEAKKALERYYQKKDAINARRNEKIPCPDCGKEMSRGSLRLHKKKFHP